MDAKQAERLLREHVTTTTEFVLCDAVPDGLYLVDGSDEYLFAIVNKGYRVGGQEFMAVNKTTGIVRSAGFVGE